eukprot:369103_1
MRTREHDQEDEQPPEQPAFDSLLLDVICNEVQIGLDDPYFSGDNGCLSPLIPLTPMAQLSPTVSDEQHLRMPLVPCAATRSYRYNSAPTMYYNDTQEVSECTSGSIGQDPI